MQHKPHTMRVLRIAHARFGLRQIKQIFAVLKWRHTTLWSAAFAWWICVDVSKPRLTAKERASSWSPIFWYAYREKKFVFVSEICPRRSSNAGIPMDVSTIYRGANDHDLPAITPPVLLVALALLSEGLRVEQCYKHSMSCSLQLLYLATAPGSKYKAVVNPLVSANHHIFLIIQDVWIYSDYDYLLSSDSSPLGGQ